MTQPCRIHLTCHLFGCAGGGGGEDPGDAEGPGRTAEDAGAAAAEAGRVERPVSHGLQLQSLLRTSAAAVC